MNQTGKLAGAILVGFIALMVLLVFGSTLLCEAEVQDTESQDVGFQLWEMRPLELLILSVMMFAAVLGILKLVGGEFRWN